MRQREIDRLEHFLAFDASYGAVQPLFGMDEAGRGALVGPVVAACVCLDGAALIEGINDSKKIAEKRREKVASCIREQAVCYGIGSADVAEIETYNILNATKIAMARAFEAMPSHECFMLIDAMDPLLFGACGAGIIHGDSKSYAIAAASILAKTHRDGLMRTLALEYPGYGFDIHKGYGTKAHIAAIRALGPSPMHRLSFLKGILHG